MEKVFFMFNSFVIDEFVFLSIHLKLILSHQN